MPAASNLFSVLPDYTPDDSRLKSVRHLNQHFKCPEYSSRKEWEARAKEIRRHILVSCGIYPEPEKTPLKANVFGLIERDGYSVEKVHFESLPGFLTTGNLYRPLKKKGPFPGVLTPHGHWGPGRLANEEAGSIPGRSINFARQGYVTFTYDMIGYNDSMQVAHALRNYREELWGINQMGLHLWSSIRGLDFLLSLDDVDPKRIACTGASGGGTQTFMVTAVDDRIAVSAPVNMVSGTMQGGCLCENAPGLRQDIMNSEIAACTAPRPLLLVSCTGDWTRNTPTEEYPDIRRIYNLFGAEDKVHNTHVDAGHNYNQDSREAVYTFFKRHLAGDKGNQNVKEKPFEVESNEDLLVFPNKELPDGYRRGTEMSESLVAFQREQMEKILLTSQTSLKKFKSQMRPALEHTLNVSQPKAGEIDVTGRGADEGEGHKCEKLLLGRKGVGDQVPALFFSPAKPRAKAPVVLLLHQEGKNAFLEGGCEVGESIEAFLTKKMFVMIIDPFLTGEYQRPGGTIGRSTAGITHWTTYNRTDHAERIQDILTSIAYLKTRKETEEIHLVGLSRAGIWSLFASALTKDIARTALDMDKLDLSNDEEWLADLYIPGLRRIGDITTAALLVCPGPLMLMNTGDNFDAEAITAGYENSEGPQFLRLRPDLVPPKGIANYLMSNQ